MRGTVGEDIGSRTLARGGAWDKVDSCKRNVGNAADCEGHVPWRRHETKTPGSFS